MLEQLNPVKNQHVLSASCIIISYCKLPMSQAQNSPDNSVNVAEDGKERALVLPSRTDCVLRARALQYCVTAETQTNQRCTAEKGAYFCVAILLIINPAPPHPQHIHYGHE